MIGVYDSQVAFGQSRVLLVWTRLIMPNGRSIVLERQEGADTAGYSGLEDDVDNHLGTLFKAALLLASFRKLLIEQVPSVYHMGPVARVTFPSAVPISALSPMTWASAHASEQDRPDVVKRRQDWVDNQPPVDPGCLVFIDETWRARLPVFMPDHSARPSHSAGPGCRSPR